VGEGPSAEVQILVSDTVLDFELEVIGHKIEDDKVEVDFKEAEEDLEEDDEGANCGTSTRTLVVAAENFAPGIAD